MNGLKRGSLRRIAVEYPRHDEAIASGPYTFRIQATPPGRIEASIDSGEWLLCRESLAYWWFDWHASPGRHTIGIRLVDEDEAVIETAPPRRFRVTD